MVIDGQLLLFQIILAIGMFFLINWLGRCSESFGYMSLSLFVRADTAPAFNLTFRVLTPVVFLIVVSATLYSLDLDWLTHEIFWVVIFYFAFRLIFNLAMQRWRLLNWSMFAVHFFLTTGLAWLAYKYLIIKRSTLLPDAKTIGNELWLAIAGFLYLLFNRVRPISHGAEDRKIAYLRRSYIAYKKKYQAIIREETQNRKLEALIFAVIILEAFNRPKLHRLLERALFAAGLAKSLGVMQVRTNEPISDERSVQLGSRRLLANHKAVLASPELAKAGKIYERMGLAAHHAVIERDVIHLTLVNYNYSGDYAREAETLYDTILSEFYPDCQDSLLDTGGIRQT
jgi:hypothetical protein